MTMHVEERFEVRNVFGIEELTTEFSLAKHFPTMFMSKFGQSAIFSHCKFTEKLKNTKIIVHDRHFKKKNKGDKGEAAR